MELPTLSDGVVTLRPRRLEDADAVTAACQDAEIPRWTLVPSPYTREHAVEWLSHSEPDMAQFFAVDADDRLLGSFSVMEIDRERGYGEIGYWVAAEARGRGVATRAVALLRDWSASAGLRELEILPDPANTASCRVAERAGFTLLTGERRANPRDPAGEVKYVVYRWRASAVA